MIKFNLRSKFSDEEINGRFISWRWFPLVVKVAAIIYWNTQALISLQDKPDALIMKHVIEKLP